jgi:hypothetical protein
MIIIAGVDIQVEKFDPGDWRRPIAEMVLGNSMTRVIMEI